MIFSDVKIQHIYKVYFDPVRQCEFDGWHLALVLKRNNDAKTFIVMPLTSESNGVGINKIKLGTINTLPTSLKNNITYAVFNQIRTVNANRFVALKENTDRIEVPIDSETFYHLLYLGLNDIMYDVPQNEKINLFKFAYNNECVVKLKNSAYNIMKLQKEIECKENEIKSIKQDISEILNNVPLKFIRDSVDALVQNVIDDVLNKN